jgi:hypothetical protein
MFDLLSIITYKIFQSVIYLFLAANALKVFMFYIMFRVFISADSISNKTIMPDIFEHSGFLNVLFIFRHIKDLLCIIKIHLVGAKETPKTHAIANSTRRRS